MDDSDAKKAPPRFLVGDSSGERAARDIDFSKIRERLASSVVKIPELGRVVLCDDCGEDFTDSPAVGGILFVSRACCPSCAPRWEANAKKYGEDRYIRARCPEGKSFADWVREDLRSRVVVR